MAGGHAEKTGDKREIQKRKQIKKRKSKAEQDYEIVQLLSDVKTYQDISLRIAEFRNRRS